MKQVTIDDFDAVSVDDLELISWRWLRTIRAKLSLAGQGQVHPRGRGEHPSPSRLAFSSQYLPHPPGNLHDQH